MEAAISLLTDITYVPELILDILINGNASKCQGLIRANNLRRSYRASVSYALIKDERLARLRTNFQGTFGLRIQPGGSKLA